MELIDNFNRLLGDDLKRALKPGARLKVAASCFSMYAFEALKEELEQVDELHSIFTSPTFMAEEVTNKIRKERKEFHIPKFSRERSLCGSEFEIHLRNRLTRLASKLATPDAPETLEPSTCPCTVSPRWTSATSPATPSRISSDEPPFTATYLKLFDQIWKRRREGRRRDRGHRRPRRHGPQGSLAREHLLPDALRHLQRAPGRRGRGRSSQ